MALQYRVWTPEEIQARNLVPEGEYPFKITSCEKKLSKSNVPMLVFDFDFQRPTGEVRKIREWVLLTDEWDWKLRHIARATGMLDRYTAKSLDHFDFIGKSGRFELGQKLDQNKENMQNFVKSYFDKVATANDKAPPKAKADADFQEDKDIPF